MTNKNGNTTNKELLIRIDERQKRISKDIKRLNGGLAHKVSDDDDYKDLKLRVTKLWDWRNRTMGYAAGAGAVAGLVFNIVIRVF